MIKNNDFVSLNLRMAISFNSHEKHIKALLFPFYRKGNCKLENLSNLWKSHCKWESWELNPTVFY